jgi:LysM repeat protein
MASLTHLKAQYLLQAAADNILTPFDETNLNGHLAKCEECRHYAEHLGKLQDDLRRITRYRWNHLNAILSADEIKNRSAIVKAQAYNLQILGKFSVAMVVLAILFILTINISSTIKGTPAAISVLSLTPEETVLTPTPSITGTVTNSLVQECNDIAYIVQENDTLDSIAARHSISKDTIKQHNGLAVDMLTVDMVLVIPVCERTPANSTITPTTTATP